MSLFLEKSPGLNQKILIPTMFQRTTLCLYRFIILSVIAVFHLESHSHGIEIATPKGLLVTRNFPEIRNGICSVNQIQLTSKQWFQISSMETAAPEIPKAGVLVFINGDHLRGTMLETDGDSITWQPNDRVKVNEPLRFPVSAVQEIVITQARQLPISQNITDRDKVIFAHQTQLLGTVLTAKRSADELIVRSAERNQSLKLSEVSRIVWNPALQRKRPLPVSFDRIILRDGSRITLLKLSCDGKLITGSTIFRQVISISCADVFRIEHTEPTIVRLLPGQPEPIANQRMSFFINQRFHIFCQGWQMEGGQEISFNLKKKYASFHARLGLDAITASRGSAQIQILLDDIPVELPNHGNFSGAEDSLLINIPLKNVSELKIRCLELAQPVQNNGLNVVNPVWIQLEK
ncbi:MAG: NPCBM/NEW2 domain-containing protein [Zavarzinella sp.]